MINNSLAGWCFHITGWYGSFKKWWYGSPPEVSCPFLLTAHASYRHVLALFFFFWSVIVYAILYFSKNRCVKNREKAATEFKYEKILKCRSCSLCKLMCIVVCFINIKYICMLGWDLNLLNKNCTSRPGFLSQHAKIKLRFKFEYVHSHHSIAT